MKSILGVCILINLLVMDTRAAVDRNRASANSPFAATTVLSFTPNHVFVAGNDTVSGMAAVFEFDVDGTFVRKIVVPAGGAGSYMQGLVFSPDGSLYGALGRLFGLERNPQQVVRIDPNTNQTVILTATNFVLNPVGMALGPQGHLYVGNYDSSGAVMVFDKSGTLVASNSPGLGKAPAWITFGPEGHIYVSIKTAVGPGEIQEWDADLRYIRTFGADTLFGQPGPLVFAHDGTIYVPDSGRGGIRHFDADGVALGDWPTQPLHAPTGAALGPDGNLHVTGFLYGVDAIVLDFVTGATRRTLSHPDLYGSSGLAFAPYRFDATLRGTIVGASTSSARLTEAHCVVWISPGSGTVMVKLANQSKTSDLTTAFNTDTLVFHGNDAVAPNGKCFITQAASVFKHATNRIIGSVSISATGKTNSSGYFAPRSISGTVHVSRPGVGAKISFTSTIRTP